MARPVEGAESRHCLVGAAVAGGKQQDIVVVPGSVGLDCVGFGVEPADRRLGEVDALGGERRCQVERDVADGLGSPWPPTAARG